jgi:hypothetical protein
MTFIQALLAQLHEFIPESSWVAEDDLSGFLREAAAATTPQELPDITIDREALRLVERLQQEIDIFRGIRHLWAESVANHKEMILTPEQMLQRQTGQLWSIGGAAMNLAAYAFPGQSPHRKFAWREVTEERDYDDPSD